MVRAKAGTVDESTTAHAGAATGEPRESEERVTLDEALKLEAGEELDAIVAEKVMGWYPRLGYFDCWRKDEVEVLVSSRWHAIRRVVLRTFQHLHCGSVERGGVVAES